MSTETPPANQPTKDRDLVENILTVTSCVKNNTESQHVARYQEHSPNVKDSIGRDFLDLACIQSTKLSNSLDDREEHNTTQTAVPEMDNDTDTSDSDNENTRNESQLTTDSESTSDGLQENTSSRDNIEDQQHKSNHASLSEATQLFDSSIYTHISKIKKDTGQRVTQPDRNNDIIKLVLDTFERSYFILAETDDFIIEYSARKRMIMNFIVKNWMEI